MKFIAHRYTIRQNLLSIFCFCLSIYFTYHAAFGTRSYFRLLTLEKDTASLSTLYDDLHNQRLAIEDRVVRLRPASLDADLLEERIRLVLGYNRANEKILFFDSQ